MMMVDKFAAVQIGQAVRVLRPYTGNGTWGHDGNEGVWYVVGKLAPLDFKLARNAGDDWQIVCHASRVLETTNHLDHPELTGR